MVLGLAGLGSAWRGAHHVWGLPSLVGELLMLAAVLVWLAVVGFFALKWIYARQEALAELLHPVQSCFVGLGGVTTMLVAGAVLPYSRLAAAILFAIGAILTFGFGVWRTAVLWHGGRDPGTTTPVLYLITAAGSFVAAAVAAGLGVPDWGQLAFGAGLFTWLSIESVLLHRLYTGVTLPPALRPTLGIQLAPPTVGGIAYVAVTAGPPDWLAHALFGYGALQALILLRLLPWIRQQPFSASYWAFSFGVAALATLPIRMIERGETGPVAVVAPYFFVAANVVIAALALATLRLLVLGRLLSPPAPTPPLPPRA
jgi:tellurite resistance protein